VFVCVCKDSRTCARRFFLSSSSGVAMGRRKCSSVPVCSLVDDYIFSFPYLLFYLVEEYRLGRRRQVFVVEVV
jgi:hypothetical protein